MTTEFKLVPVELIGKILSLWPDGAENDGSGRIGWAPHVTAAVKELSDIFSSTTPPQPIYDDSTERDRFDAEYDKICCRTGITIREIAWRIWQARAKAGEVL